MRPVSLAVWVLVLAITNTRAEITPIPGRADPRIRSAPYNADEVYRLYGFVGYDIGLEFDTDETFKRVNGGDLKALTYSAQENTFTFKPRVRTTHTNLTVTTNKRRYYIEYSATDMDPAEDATAHVIYVVRFIYPPQGARELTPAEQVEADLAEARASRRRNTDYWFCGRPELKPTAAFDDGVHTHLNFGPRAEIPAVFLRNEDGSESLVNFTVTGGDLVVHRVVRQLVLRRGRLVACVVNKSYQGSGERLDSGTLSQDVERAHRAGAP